MKNSRFAAYERMLSNGVSVPLKEEASTPYGETVGSATTNAVVGATRMPVNRAAKHLNAQTAHKEQRQIMQEVRRKADYTGGVSHWDGPQDSGIVPHIHHGVTDIPDGMFSAVQTTKAVAARNQQVRNAHTPRYGEQDPEHAQLWTGISQARGLGIRSSFYY